MPQDNDNALRMKFDPRTIEHLGIQMYSTLPPVLGELVSNAYDAEALKVDIFLSDLNPNNKSIEISDTGIGMSYDEINNKFLIIGRNRREDEQTEWSKNNKRLVIGKKGLGKLAFFGVANHIRIETVQNFKKTSFELDWEAIKKSGLSQNEYYNPPLIERELDTAQKQGTKIILSGIKRKSAFSKEQIARSIARSFQVLDLPDFEVFLHYNDEDPLKIINEMRYDGIEPFCSWQAPDDFPLDAKDVFPEYANQISGKLISSKTTVTSDMNGIALFSRGKLVNSYNFLDLKTTSHGYSYITGWLDVSYIESLEEEVISTNRQSLNWELESTADLKVFLEILYKSFFNYQKNMREEAKKKEVEGLTGLELDTWYETLPKHERKLAKKMIGAIIAAEGIDVDKAVSLVQYTQDSFQFESFKELANDLDESGFEAPERIISFFHEWKLVEAKEMYKIAFIRIETIKKFKDLIARNSREVPEIHNFLKQFPWLLDPRIMNFKDEVTYSQLLKDNFPESDEVPEEDRRIDFLCQNFANTYFIIELKRPKRKISFGELQQALSYSAYLKTKISNEFQSNVICYIIGDSLVNRPEVKSLADSLRNSNNVIFRPYEELLNAARNYHQEFIDQYELLQNSL